METFLFEVHMKNIQELIDELDLCHKKLDSWFVKMIDAQLVYEQLESSEKYVYLKNLPDEGTELVKRKAAETSEEYSTHRKAIHEAKALYKKIYARVEPVKMRIESLRTEISAVKQEARNFSGQ